MLAIFDERQLLHRPLTRIAGGELRPSPEQPERIAALLSGLEAAGIAVQPPHERSFEIIAAVHDRDYLTFLQTGFQAWRELPGAGPELRSSVHPSRHMSRLPRDLLGRAGFYQADASCVLVEGTWEAARASANTAVDAMTRVLEGERSAYALCRPPGHHAYRDQAGGFCYLNNTAIAANLAASQEARAAIVHVDVHHGNGTQALFYNRRDVLTVSVHGDPAHLYPYYAGYSDETGAGHGEGHNLNLPVPLMSGTEAYLAAVTKACEAVRQFSPDILIIALGLDASKDDPFACMAVDETGFRRMGEMLAALTCPTLIVQEGGYPSPTLGSSLAAFLGGFAGR
ncbi:histone deacetylase family protein [Mesorhizobium sp. M4A.F.Ca.ET.020.02.1.1]|uniref:histone deacetylase family protein n=1 Tax=unclassified Mesorhizobium TaxID=325217 RepID=UPI000FD3D631|nr:MULTISPECIES: histone deacetylase family protein [unclassified Mesorhizobium]RVD33493.1 histone deacetylase family protein [Mesorhizobium sp. M4A.F.Ca.ET.020.02.1.1]RWC15560.1 MAG: histone deacetylase family protein [Mesorhizobium sp.]